MDFDDQRVDASGLDDRRGRSTGGNLALGGGGLGVVGVIVVIVLQLVGGGGGGGGLDLSQLQGQTSGSAEQGSGESRDQLEARCNADGGIDRYDDCFVLKSFNEINEVWSAEFDRRGSSYAPPRLVFFSDAVSTGCGQASAQTGPFYCPPDQEVYLDLTFLAQLQQQFGAQGRYAQSYIVAHEVGHHLQTLFGTEAKVRAAQQRDPSRTNELSVQLELQADCYAGVWGKLANEGGNLTISTAELAQAQNAAAAVGDDRIQQQETGHVDPDSFTHGSAEQRRDSYDKGYGSGDLDSCAFVV